MRKSTLLWTLLIALTALCSPLVADEMEMTADDVIVKLIEARGGREAWDAIKTTRMTGTMSMGGGAESPFVIEFKRPDQVRLEFTFQGMTGIQAYSGGEGWAVMPFMGKTAPEKMADDQLKQMADQADFEGPLVDYAEKGHSVELVGKEEVEGTEAYHLKLTKKDGDVVHSYVDSEHFLEFKQATRQEIQGQDTEVEVILGDYKEVGGILIPYSIEQRFNQGTFTQTMTIDDVKLNVDIDDDRFAMPETAAAEGAADTGGNG